MARKAIEILKGRGYTDEELKSMETLLKDPKFTGAIEAEALAADNNAALVAANKKWYEDQAVPAIEKATKDAVEAAAREASLKARIKAAADQGLSIQAAMEGFEPTAPNPTPNPTNPNPGNLDPSKFVDTNTFQQAFGRTGDAMALMGDIMQEHRELFGARLPVRELLAEAREKKTTFEAVWLDKYSVAAKRAEIDAAAKKKQEDDIRADERRKVASEYANPATRPMGPSANPIFSRTVEEKNQPWRRSPEQLQADRVARMAAKFIQ